MVKKTKQQSSNWNVARGLDVESWNVPHMPPELIFQGNLPLSSNSHAKKRLNYTLWLPSWNVRKRNNIRTKLTNFSHVTTLSFAPQSHLMCKKRGWGVDSEWVLSILDGSTTHTTRVCVRFLAKINNNWAPRETFSMQIGERVLVSVWARDKEWRVCECLRERMVCLKAAVAVNKNSFESRRRRH